MLNAELIEKLSAFPLDMEVWTQGEYDYVPTRDVVVVRSIGVDIIVVE